ncbi:hypothetical protein BHQ17_00055 [Mycolicibacterium holsaticum]|uniref:Phage portal protein n=1 Tax=Mycolicibacterium holsaticum TaxID=152142 RepID=A0A1E3S3B4_9MYCO|nr:hypothetical protein BHQ17_00055 [Mycolicibacterium holsaticum]
METLDSYQARYELLQKYASGTQQLAWISPESRKMLGNRLSRMAVNIPALAVSSLVERLRPIGYSNPRAWELFMEQDLDVLASQAMTDSLTFSKGFVLVWAKNGIPVATVESPFQCAVLRDPADRSPLAGVKRYTTKTESHSYIYTPESVQHWRADSPSPALGGYELVEELVNPLGVVPLVEFDNGRSEISDLMPLVDSLNKLVLDMMTASEAAGKPRRWISGLELKEQPRLDSEGAPVLDDDGDPIIDVVSPIDDVNVIQTMISENEETKFGQLPASDLSGFEAGVRIIVSSIMAVSALPSHYLGVLTSQPTSSDALRASEASLTARAEQRQLAFSRPLEQVGRLLLAVETGAAPDMPLRVSWADAATRSVAQDADAASKLYQIGLLSRETTLRRLGFTDAEIAEEMRRHQNDMQLGEDAKVGSYLAAINRTRTFEGTDAVRN